MPSISAEQRIVGWKKWEKTFLSVETIALILLSIVLYADFQRRLDAGTREQVGTITFKQKTVQRKYSDRTVWESMESSFPLYNKDSIRTGDLSDAEITLNDGTKLEVDENTLIMLNISKDEQEIDFAYGSIAANRDVSGDTSGGLLSIRSGENRISVDTASLSLVQTEAKNLIVDVQSGIANLFVGDEKQEISSQEKVTLSGNDIQVTKKLFSITQPPPIIRKVTSSDRTSIEYIVDGYSSETNSTLEFSRSRDFKNIYSKRNIRSEKFDESFSPGVTYWRAVAGGKVASLGKISILQVKPSRLVSPRSKAIIFTQKNSTLVSFSWIREERNSQSVLEISQDPDFKTLTEEKSSLGSSISLELGPGEYYWRVKSVIDKDEAPIYSIAQNFSITRDEPKNPPILLHPKSGDLFSESIASKAGVNFFWSQLKGYKDYELEIAQSSAMKDPIQVTSQGKTTVLYKTDYKQGEYYWRVRGVTPSGSKGEYSTISKFSVTALTKNIFNLQSDTIVRTTNMKNDAVVLRWKKLPINGTYEVLLAKDKDFTQVAKRIVTNLNQAKIDELTKGKYFWKVSLLDEQGNPSLVSDHRELEIGDGEKIFRPRKGEVVNMTSKDNLLFEWQSISNIQSYNIIIYNINNNQKKQILQKSSSTNSFLLDEIELLDKGRFSWEVYYEENGQRKLDFNSDFQIELDPISEQLELLTPKVQYAD